MERGEIQVDISSGFRKSYAKSQVKSPVLSRTGYSFLGNPLLRRTHLHVPSNAFVITGLFAAGVGLLKYCTASCMVISQVRPNSLFQGIFLTISACSSNLIDRLPPSSSSVSGALHSKNVFETMLMNDDVCDHEAVILVHQPGVCVFFFRTTTLFVAKCTLQLHASDLRQLPKTSHIARSLSSASSSRQYAYVPAMYTSDEDEHHLEFAQSVSQKCHARLLNILAGQGGDVDFQAGGQKSVVVVVNLPGVEGSQSESRINGMAEHGALGLSIL